MLSDYVLVDPSLWFGFPAELCLLSGVLLPWSYLCETSTVQLQHLWLRWQMKGLFPHQTHILIFPHLVSCRGHLERQAEEKSTPIIFKMV